MLKHKCWYRLQQRSIFWLNVFEKFPTYIPINLYSQYVSQSTFQFQFKFSRFSLFILSQHFWPNRLNLKYGILVEKKSWVQDIEFGIDSTQFDRALSTKVYGFFYSPLITKPLGIRYYGDLSHIWSNPTDFTGKNLTRWNIKCLYFYFQWVAHVGLLVLN